jgi:hypothetical protein
MWPTQQVGGYGDAFSSIHDVQDSNPWSKPAVLNEISVAIKFDDPTLNILENFACLSELKDLTV